MKMQELDEATLVGLMNARDENVKERAQAEYDRRRAAQEEQRRNHEQRSR